MPTGERIEEENKKLVSKPLARFANTLLLGGSKKELSFLLKTLAVRVGRMLLFFFFRKRKGM
tara:strand:+ start:3869 stop:4054 length:186 start_codon:yes stop_codon:yes gene_type:complete